MGVATSPSVCRRSNGTASPGLGEGWMKRKGHVSDEHITRPELPSSSVSPRMICADKTPVLADQLLLSKSSEAHSAQAGLRVSVLATAARADVQNAKRDCRRASACPSLPVSESTACPRPASWRSLVESPDGRLAVAGEDPPRVSPSSLCGTVRASCFATAAVALASRPACEERHHRCR